MEAHRTVKHVIWSFRGIEGWSRVVHCRYICSYNTGPTKPRGFNAGAKDKQTQQKHNYVKRERRRQPVRVKLQPPLRATKVIIRKGSVQVGPAGRR